MKLKFESVTKSYGDKIIFKELNETFHFKGEITAILGESGSGKSTLLNLLFGIDQDYDGIYSIDGRNAKDLSDAEWDYLRSSKIQIVYQDFKLLEKFTVSENLYFANRLDGDDYLARRDELLKLLNLNSVKDSLVKDISGGQKQRVAVARALLNRPEVVLLDEPTGNLDQENALELLDYLKKIKTQGKSIYIITHDERVLAFADNIYQLNNQTLIVQKKASENEKSEGEMAHPQINRVSFKTILSYIHKDISRNLKDLFLISTPLVLLLSIFILLLTGFKQVTLDSFTNLFKGLSETTMYLDAQTLTKDYQKELSDKQIQSSSDGKRLYFSETDFKEMKEINQVKKVVPFNFANFIIDANGNELQETIDTEDFPKELKQLSSFSTAPSVIQFTFQSLLLPNEDFHLYNPNHITILSGHLPQTDTEILIPDFYESYLSSKKQSTDELTLNVRALANSSIQNKFFKQNYQVAGIYETDYRNSFIPQMRINNSNAFPIYTKYRETTDLKAIKSQEEYKQAQESSSINENTLDYMKNILKDYNSYVKSVGTGKMSVLIVAENEKAVPNITKELESKYPHYQIRSRYSLTNGEFAATYHQLLFTLIVGIAVATTLMIVIFAFLNRQTIAYRKKELATLFSLGYSRSNVKLIISGEILSQFICIYGLGVALIWLMDHFYLSTSSYSLYFVDLFSWVNQLLVLGVIIVTAIVSTLWGVASVKKKKLIDSLK
ncbi:ATP-binding cassette domain-containing protein [Enterococcus faecalis]|uniref:ABC transporter ATP-binding protein/permease n=1 Tax=Enterococcus faecalis TaxID=1351 RepID=UPI0018CC8E87|nr:ATP-binding cassette domain-containing protein [Enterococcus faecalis]EGO5016469.1 ATP-binding cassette domain-containing protein [Enterococcus faecalis]EGO6561340.1 ATP-binding cassette domain-containing protein [Enterococcus faecalis]EGO7560941.1 ATP-binding cassette domain-containing protein [Enterococcus faecalis]EGO7742713.1 ATP-binding cassette domain-containing protein [Enterococcus faecalis]EIP7780853.1 ATP-binding cassette domain-containing protein [Enterococcus faecalis]